MSPRRSDAGFVLVNALVLVAAMAAAAVFLLARAEGGRSRLEVGQTEQVLRHGLDAVEALSRGVLNADLRAGPIDSPDDMWSTPVRDEALQQGHVSGQITDQQSLFNINWLADMQNDTAKVGFSLLLSRIGLSPAIGDAVTAFVSPEGPSNRHSYRALTPQVSPLGGAIFLPDQLALIPNIAQRDLDRLQPFITVLPPSSSVNVNTVTEPVLAAILPQITAARIPVLLRRRASEPYNSVEDFLLDAGLSTDLEASPDAVDPNRFSISSNWFGVQIIASEGGRSAQRRVLLRRESTQEGTQVEWRVSRY